VFESAVVGFDPVVLVAFDVVPGCRHQFVEHAWVARRFVGDHRGRGHLRGGTRLVVGEPTRLGGVTSAGVYRAMCSYSTDSAMLASTEKCGELAT
jgi:hypothetical protein